MLRSIFVLTAFFLKSFTYYFTADVGVELRSMYLWWIQCYCSLFVVFVKNLYQFIHANSEFMSLYLQIIFETFKLSIKNLSVGDLMKMTCIHGNLKHERKTNARFCVFSAHFDSNSAILRLSKVLPRNVDWLSKQKHTLFRYLCGDLPSTDTKCCCTSFVLSSNYSAKFFEPSRYCG